MKFQYKHLSDLVRCPKSTYCCRSHHRRERQRVCKSRRGTLSFLGEGFGRTFNAGVVAKCFHQPARREWESPIGRPGGVNQRLVTRITLAIPKVVIPDSITINGNIITHLRADPEICRSANGY